MKSRRRVNSDVMPLRYEGDMSMAAAALDKIARAG
jgi:hypothetical protein